MTVESPFKTRMQREADREAKREAVLRAAVRMFNERGFFSTTFDDIAAVLGVSKPTIYHYLGNKEEVLFECVRRGIDELKEAAQVAAAAHGDGLDRLRAFLVRWVQINTDDFGRCVIRTPEEGLSSEIAARFRALKRGIDASLRDLISEAMKDGSIAHGDARLIAFTVAGALNWPARWYKAERDGPNRQVIAETMVGLLINGMREGVPSTQSAKPPTKQPRKPAGTGA